MLLFFCVCVCVVGGGGGGGGGAGGRELSPPFQYILLIKKMKWVSLFGVDVDSC